MLCFKNGEYIFSNFLLPITLNDAKAFLRGKSKEYIKEISNSLNDIVFICPCRHWELSIGDYFSFDNRLFIKGRYDKYYSVKERINYHYDDDLTVIYGYVFIKWIWDKDWVKYNLTKQLVY